MGISSCSFIPTAILVLTVAWHIKYFSEKSTGTYFKHNGVAPGLKLDPFTALAERLTYLAVMTIIVEGGNSSGYPQAWAIPSDLFYLTLHPPSFRWQLHLSLFYISVTCKRYDESVGQQLPA